MFLHVYVGEGRENNKTFGSTSLQTIQPKVLYIRDVGYFDLHDLQKMNDEGAYYVSRLKLNTRIYLKNDKPEFFRNGTINKGILCPFLRVSRLYPIYESPHSVSQKVKLSFKNFETESDDSIT